LGTFQLALASLMNKRLLRSYTTYQ